MRWGSRPAPANASGDLPLITAEQLLHVREPMRWLLHIGEHCDRAAVEPTLRRALLGPAHEAWPPPSWLMPHQIDAARRVAGSLELFGGALLCDAVGLGKTYVALAVATRYKNTVVSLPAVLVPQWQRTSRELQVPVTTVSHEALSRGREVPSADLIIVDEAHRFRNTNTIRYRTLARCARRAPMLLLTATPVVNRPRDILGLVRLFASDNSLALFGIESLEQGLLQSSRRQVASGIAPVTIARSHRAARLDGVAIPIAIDHAVLTPPPLEPKQLNHIIRLLDQLQFPCVGDKTATELLRIHVHHRLASSTAACVECLRRHRAYLDRAIEAARRGEQLTRRAMRRLLAPDDDAQLELQLLTRTQAPVSTTELEREQDRISTLLTVLERPRESPKMDRVRQLVRQRGQTGTSQKTIIFTSAVPTARAIATSLEWRRVAVVTGRGARIASGPVAVERALAMFAPLARRATPPPVRQHVDVLVATDLVSEGLDLYDADTVVHFDLPWNPVRLQQRVGRVARLGSPHGRVEIWWFVPPPPLERRLRLRDRIQAKVEYQKDLGVPVTSVVGRTQVLGRALEAREHLAGPLVPVAPRTPRHAVVVGRAAAAFAVRWTIADRSTADVLVIAGSPPRAITDLAMACDVLGALLRAPDSRRSHPLVLQRALEGALRTRLANAMNGAINPGSRRLMRAVVRRAARAGAARRVDELNLLDVVLDRLVRGVRLGAEHELGVLLARPEVCGLLRRWIAAWDAASDEPPTVVLEAALFGDGSEP